MIPKYLFQRNGYSEQDVLKKIITQSLRVYLFLDYDGTLTPIRKLPSSAVLSGSMKNLLSELNNQPNIKVIIVTGRSYSDFKKLSGLKNITIASNHGFHINSEKINWRHPAIKKILPVFQDVTLLLKKSLKQFPSTVIEDKGITVSVHYRNVKNKFVPSIKETVLYILERYSQKLKITYGKKVIEIKPAVEWNKGLAVLKILKLFRLKTSNSTMIYIGDDTTDEDAFKILRNKAITVHVGNSSETNAEYIVKNTREVQSVLRSINSIFKERNKK